MSESEGVKRRRSRRRGRGGRGNRSNAGGATSTASGSGSKSGAAKSGAAKDGTSQRRARRTAMYRRKIDEQLFGKKSERPRLRMEQRLKDAHRTPNFQRTFREYAKAHGMPEDTSLLLILLDLEDERDLLQVTGGIEAMLESQSVNAEQKSVLRSRLRNIEMSTESDAVADAAADLIERL